MHTICFSTTRELLGIDYNGYQSFLTVVCQINILVGVQALAWFCQTKVWTPFYESLWQRRAKLQAFPNSIWERETRKAFEQDFTDVKDKQD
jgi:hypothetical protein